MSTKALRKELFAAVAMLIVAAIALSGSTYAWFAANTTVTAENMQVTVVSDTTFLLIKQGHAADAATVQASKLTVDSAEMTNAAIMPVAHKTEVLSNIAAVEVNADGDANEWYYTYSADPSKATTAGMENNWLTYTSAAAVNVTGGYILANEFSLAVADGSNGVKDLQVSECAINSTSAAAVKVIVATDEGAAEFEATEAGTTTTAISNNVLAAMVTPGAVKYVKIYVYWDGNDADVYTNNIANLLGTSVVVSFKGTAAAPQNN